MDDAAFVRAVQRLDDLRRDGDRFADIHRTVCQPVSEVLAFDELHDERRRILEYSIHLGDVGMVQRGQRLRLPFETHEPVPIRREQLGQDLDGGVAIELRITRAIHLAHPTDAHLTGYLIGAEASTR